MPKFSSFRTLGRFALPWASAVVWLLATAGLVFWFLQWPVPDAKTHLPTVVSQQPASSGPNAMLAKALGQAQEHLEVVAPSSSQFKLIGVMASPSGQGTALIAVDGQPPQIFRVGQAVQDGWILDALSTQQARLTSAGAQVLLDMPPMVKP